MKIKKIKVNADLWRERPTSLVDQWYAVFLHSPLALNILGLSLMTSYLTLEYFVPFVQRKWSAWNFIRRHLGLPMRVSLTRHEEEIASAAAVDADALVPNIQNDEQIAGLDSLICELEANIRLASAPTSKALRSPQGILLYGPPGCGKTMLARHVARLSGFRFLNVPISLIMDKWVARHP